MDVLVTRIFPNYCSKHIWYSQRAGHSTESRNRMVDGCGTDQGEIFRVEVLFFNLWSSHVQHIVCTYL